MLGGTILEIPRYDPKEFLMCGVAAILNLKSEKNDKSGILKMMNSLDHRGPDGEGSWCDDLISLGHKRLSIIDLTEAANQPMHTIDNRFHLVFNGEIYNFKELREILTAEGIHFRTNSDTEVLMHALVTWDTRALSKLNGMFAFVFWDSFKKRIIIGRDRYGIKPLYIGEFQNKILIASENKAIHNHSSFRKAIDNDAIFEYFNFQNIFSNKTFSKNVSLFPAGYYATIDMTKEEKKLEFFQYWDYHFETIDNKSDDREYEEELTRLLEKAVTRHLLSDVEIGSYLSGGIDSGGITAIASKHLDKLKTFTIGFDMRAASGLEMAFDERPSAESMARQLRTEHYEMVLNSGHLKESLHSIVWHLEEPRVGQSYPNFYAAKLASNFVKVALSGTGGDELFGGYPWRYYVPTNALTWTAYTDNYFNRWQRLLNDEELKQVFSPISKSIDMTAPKRIFNGILDKKRTSGCTQENYVNLSMYLEAKTFLQGLFLVEDKLSMAFGLENRVPFMDNDLVDFAQQCPVRLKVNLKNLNAYFDENTIGNKRKIYESFNNNGKSILRSSLSSHLPPERIQAAKQGFSAPDSSWFKGESLEFVKSLLNKNAQIYEFLEYKAISSLLQKHFDGKENRRLLIWSLIYFETWLSQQ